MLPSQTDVLIIGGGPAGTLLGCLLARRGVSVLVVEKQSRAERTFRGESIMGPAVDVLRRLGFGPALRAHGYFETLGLTIAMEGRQVLNLGYRRFATAALPIDIPQTSLIEIFDRAGEQEPGYRRITGTAMTELIEQDGKVVGDAIDAARVALKKFYKEDEAQAFDGWVSHGQNGAPGWWSARTAGTPRSARRPGSRPPSRR